MTTDAKRITAVIPTDQPEPDLQARAAAYAEATVQGLVLDGEPMKRTMQHGRRRYYEFTWDVRPDPTLG